MKRISVAGWLVAALAVAAYAEDALVAVRLARAADAYVLLERGVRVVEARRTFALAWVPAGRASALAGFTYETLGFPSGPVYLAWPRRDEPLPAARGVTVLAVFGDTYVVSGMPAAVEELTTEGVELKRVSVKPLVKPTTSPPPPGPPRNDLVEAAVARVREDRYFSYLEDLAAVPTRYSHSPTIEQATAYLEDEFGALGYETQRLPYDYDLGTYDYWYDCDFRAGGRLGWLVSAFGYVWRTEDYGETWTPVVAAGKLTSGVFATDDVGYAVGGRDYLGRTTDGGASWHNLGLADPDDDLQGVYFYDAARGCAGGENGAVYRTVDGGASWAKVATPTAVRLYEFYSRDGVRWWAVGAKGVVLRSDDGALSWYVYDVPATEGFTMRDVCFADDLHGVIVGYEGTILYTADAGVSWTRVSGYYPAWPFFTEVAFADATRGWAVGSEGCIYRTDDAGASWALQPTPLSDYFTFTGVTALSRDDVWAAAAPAALVRTADGGAVWSEVPVRDGAAMTWYNVEATKPGVTRPGEIYILCGHYDSTSEDPWNLAPGAEDNASGTAAVLEAAAALKDCRFDATLRFIAFSGEEQGLIGSRAYAEESRAAGEDIRGVFNMDMVSYLDEPAHDVDVRYNDFSQGLLAVYEAAAHAYVPNYDIYPETGGTGGSDHEPFWENGYAALLTIEHGGQQFYPWYHKTTDVAANLTAAFGADVTRANLAAAAMAAGPREGPVPSPDAVIAYPNPARPSAGHSRIRFANLAPHAEVRLYNLAGEEVWSACAGDAGGAVEWPLVTAAGDAAASGVYLYIITFPAGAGRAHGKVAIVR